MSSGNHVFSVTRHRGIEYPNASANGFTRPAIAPSTRNLIDGNQASQGLRSIQCGGGLGGPPYRVPGEVRGVGGGGGGRPTSVEQVLEQDLLNLSSAFLESIPGLTRELLGSFSRGVYPAKSASIFRQWKETQTASLPDYPDMAFQELIRYGEGRNVKISIPEGGDLAPEWAAYLQALLGKLPDRLIQQGYVRKISIMNNPQELNKKDVVAFPISQTFPKAITRDWVRIDAIVRFFLLLGVWIAYNQKVKKNHVLESATAVVGQGGVVYAISQEFADIDRRRFDPENLKDLPSLEILSETCLTFFVDGYGLRNHIKKLESDPAQRLPATCYRYIYDFFRENIFGQEY